MDDLEFKNVGSQEVCKVEVVGWKLVDEVRLCFLWPPGPPVLRLGTVGLVTWVTMFTFLGALSAGKGSARPSWTTGACPRLPSTAIGGGFATMSSDVPLHPSCVSKGPRRWF